MNEKQLEAFSSISIGEFNSIIWLMGQNKVGLTIRWADFLKRLLPRSTESNRTAHLQPDDDLGSRLSCPNKPNNQKAGVQLFHIILKTSSLQEDRHILEPKLDHVSMMQYH